MLYGVICALTMEGSAPFPSLTAFRTSCFKAFPVTHVQRLTHSQVSLHLCKVTRGPDSGTRARGGQILQLYVASYQAPSMWRGCYKQLSGILSAQIIKDVEGSWPTTTSPRKRSCGSCYRACLRPSRSERGSRTSLPCPLSATMPSTSWGMPLARKACRHRLSPLHCTW